MLCSCVCSCVCLHVCTSTCSVDKHNTITTARPQQHKQHKTTQTNTTQQHTNRQLACARIGSREGQDYLKAMACAANYAWVNRSSMTFLARQVGGVCVI